MLADEANLLKQKKREEQIKKWRERECVDDHVVVGGGGNYQQDQQQIIKKSSKVKFPQSCVFLAACTANDLDEVRYYLKNGVNINSINNDGLTALHQACIDDNTTMVKFLIENNADLNPQDNDGWTPLHASVSVGNLDVAKYLLSKGAKLNICNHDSDLPIDLCDVNNVQMKSYLEEEMKRQNIDAEYEKKREELIMYEDAKDSNFRDKIHPNTGATPLHVSAAKGYTRVMRMLLQAGANVNAVDKDGWTPFHAAAHWEQEESCKILAENGASFDLKNYSGQTPFDVCDEDMINKLKILQTKVKQATLQKEKSIELTSITNGSPTNVKSNIDGSRNNNRRSSEELRWGSSSNTNDTIYKRRVGPVLPTTPLSPNNVENNNNKTNDSFNNNNNNNDDVLLSPSQTLELPLSLIKNEQRRYSSAPIASKDEQAELIRKQKAKLERHYRRSTQAVSYEDIKSAEATIKASSSPSTPVIQQSNIITNTLPPPPLPQQPPPPLFPLPVVQPSTVIIKTEIETTQHHQNNDIQQKTPSQQPPTTQHNERENHTDNIILAKDIETEKLLTAIELSKGFSDSYSTTRRARNRCVAFNPNSINSDRDNDNSITNNSIKLNNLIWNHQKCEVEYRDCKEEELFQLTNNNNNNSDILPITTVAIPSNNNNSNNNSVFKRQTSLTETPKSSLQFTNQTFPTSVPTTSSSPTSQLPPQPPSSSSSSTAHTSRPMFRFSNDSQNSNQTQITNTNGSNNTNTTSRPQVKRSISQVPTTDRRPLSSPLNTNQTIDNFITNSIPVKDTLPTNMEDKQTIDTLMKENEQLNTRIQKLQKDLDDQIKKTQLAENGFADKKEKRSLDRKISELEEELKKMESLRQDNIRLKDENAALIRVISKLSK